MTDSSETKRYSAGAIALHWLIAMFILALLPVGFIMARANEALAEGQTLLPPDQVFTLYQMHKTFGILVLALSVMRLVWRLANPAPPEPASLAVWERAISALVHFLFYFLIIALPLTGWALVSASPQEVETFLFQVSALPWPHLPVLSDWPIETREALEPLFQNTHRYLAYGAAFLIALHVGAALKHQFVNRDKVLARMAPGLAGKVEKPAQSARGGVRAVLLGLGLLVGGVAVARLAPLLHGGETGAPSETTSVDADGAPESPAAGASAWIIDHDASALNFEVIWQGAERTGAFAAWSAEINFDPDNLDDAHAVVRIETASASTGVQYLDGQIPGSDGFQSDAHPVAIFETTNFNALGDDRYEAVGELTIRGETQPVALPFTLTINGDEAQMSGETTLNRLDFGLGARSDASGGSLGLEVVVRVELEATRAP